jgi:outer membrane receptor for ferrienterochelin and colicin
MMSMRRLAHGAALAALACGMATAAYAQETTSAIRGQLSGDNGAPVANATVTVVHTPSGTRLVTRSGSDGVFDARGLRVGGPYTISVTAPGYEDESVSGVNLTQAETLRLNLDLFAANAVDEVVVTAARNPEAGNAGVSSTLSRETIQTVVTVTRDIRDLARRNLLTSANSQADGGISIAGSNPKLNRITIDGASVQDDFGLNSGGLPTLRGPVSIDAVEQFTVQAVPVDVENGDFQGGAIDIVLRSGTNDFRGSAFVNYLNDGLFGEKLKGVSVPQAISQTNYGGFLAGPILKDTLFFAVSYEKYKSAGAVPTGPTGAGFPNSIRGVTQATIDQVVGILNNTYATDFDAGGIPRTTPILDEKYSGKLDWNISDRHRASFTYRYSLSEVTALSNLNTGTAGLSSNFYLSGEEDYSYVGELNSQWTDAFNTQIRVSYRDYERRQNPPGGQEFGELQICSAPTSDTVLTTCATGFSNIRIGPDAFRQANELETRNLNIQAKATYALGDHLFKLGFESQNLEIINLFVPNSDGVYYFDSIADFQAGRANRLTYSNAPSGNPFDAAALFEYQQNSVFFQDVYDVTDSLQVTAGARFDWYKSDDQPILNPFFVGRNGFDNRTTYDGKSILMPRVAFKYDPDSWFRINGGAGIFAGGIPDVLISTSFSTTGFAAAGVTIDRNADGTFRELGTNPAFTQAAGAAALNINRADPRFGFDLPAAVTGLVTPTILPTTSEVIALSPAFKIPSSWKFFLSSQADLPFGFRAQADLVVTETVTAVGYSDFKVRPLLVNGQQQFTPDGRLRYDGLTMTDAARAAAGVGGTNVQNALDLVVGNEKRGKGYVAAIGLARTFFDDSLRASIGYVRQDLKEGASGVRFGTTSGSLYGSQLAAAEDPNRDAYGTGYEEVRDRVKFELSYEKEFFENAKTRLTLFGEARSGRPFNVTMASQGGNRSPIFGTNRGAYQLFVPDFAADTNPNDLDVGLVTFDNVNTLNAFRAAVARFDLPTGIVRKGYNRNPDVNQLDLQLSQEIPTPIEGHKFKVVMDVYNVLNLLNSKWGTIEEYGNSGSGQGNNRIVDVQCATATGAAAGNGSPVCVRYRYSNPNATATTRSFAGRQGANNPSLWAAQISLRYEF